MPPVIEEMCRKIGHEFGATTGRKRLCGWFDAMLVRHAARVNGLSSLILTKLDVLDEFEEIQLCTGYTYQGKPLDHFPASLRVLEQCEPVYETWPGWRESTGGARQFSDLPANARAYIERLEEVTELSSGLFGRPVPRIVRGPRSISAALRFFCTASGNFVERAVSNACANTVFAVFVMPY
jgi:adenylosuccinate synthase